MPGMPLRRHEGSGGARSVKPTAIQFTGAQTAACAIHDNRVYLTENY